LDSTGKLERKRLRLVKQNESCEDSVIATLANALHRIAPEPFLIAGR
jgi:hypothetical protein